MIFDHPSHHIKSSQFALQLENGTCFPENHRLARRPTARCPNSAIPSLVQVTAFRIDLGSWRVENPKVKAEWVAKKSLLDPGGQSLTYIYIYTLWWTNILPWKITIFNGKIQKIHYKWPFSIAMLVHQRVYIYIYIYECLWWKVKVSKRLPAEGYIDRFWGTATLGATAPSNYVFDFCPQNPLPKLVWFKNGVPRGQEKLFTFCLLAL